MSVEADRQSEEFLKLQNVIARVLVAMYQRIQQSEADKVPGNWLPYYTNLAAPSILLGKNSQRGEVIITNDGPSDLFISNTPIQIESILQQYNGVNGQTLGVTVIKSGAVPLRINTRGALHGCPVNYGGANATCVINMVETVYEYNQNQAAQTLSPLSGQSDDLVWFRTWDKFTQKFDE